MVLTNRCPLTGGRPFGLPLFAAAVCLSALFPDEPSAQTLVLDQEPNDSPRTATPIAAPATLMGAMAAGDQDGYNWTVSDVDAGRRWTLELQGIPGRLTVVDITRVAYGDDGTVTGVKRLLKFGTRDGSLPAVRSDLIFEPGEYLLGLASAGGGGAPFRPSVDMAAFDDQPSSAAPAAGADPHAYRLFVRTGAALPSGDGREHATRDTARPVNYNGDMTVFLDGDAATWYRLDVNEAQSASRWNILVQVPVGRLATARLYDVGQQEMAAARTESDGKATLADISLPTGSYFLAIEPNLRDGEVPGYIQLLRMKEVGERIEGDEAEPNDRWTVANQADFERCCKGRVGQQGDTDLFAFTLGDAAANERHRLLLDIAPEHTARLCLLDDAGASIQCRQGAGGLALDNLLLEAGDYGVSVTSLRGEIGTGYTLSLQATGAPKPGEETEPNDTGAWAIGTPENNRIKGAFDGQGDIDFYRFILTEEAQLWRVQAIGPGIASVAYHDLAGTQKQRINAAPGQRRVQLDNLFLLPGTHLFSVTGREAGTYTLLARALGPPDPDAEREPNDDDTRMLPLRIGQTRTGILNDRADVDLYRFHLPGWDHVVLTATPPADGKLSAVLEFAGNGFGQARNVDGAITLQGVLPPGDYHLALKAIEPSDGEYQLSLQRDADPSCTGDCEPNNSATFANRLEPGEVVDGHAGAWADTDWFELPRFGTPQPVSFRFESDGAPAMRFYDESMNEVRLELDRATSTYSGTMPAGRHVYAQVGRGQPLDYRFTATLGNNAAPPAAELPVELDLDLDATVVTPYEQVGQQIGASLRLRNAGDAPLDIDLDVLTTDDSWAVEPRSARVAVAAGAQLDLDVDIIVPPDVRADRSVRIGVIATADDGRQTSAARNIEVDLDAGATNPVRAWPIPESLRGGINVARTVFGATAVTEPNANNQYDRQLPQLFDGMGKLDNGVAFGNRDDPQTITVDLAGDEPVPVSGFVLNPLYRGYRYRTAYDVEFKLSADGSVFTTAATGKLTTIGTDHFYALEEPVPARFARLVLDTSWQGLHGGGLTLGEWKVVAQPGFDALGGRSLNLASPALGGHVVWSRPGLTGPWNINILTEDAERPVSNVAPNEPLEWVVGFHHDRAARIERVVWKESTGSDVPVDRLAVSVSLESPVGPWRSVAEWARTTDGNVLAFESPVWARFMRFVVPPADERRIIELPETLEIREAPTDGGYRSVLGEWGFLNRAAYYESTLAVPDRMELTQRGNESRDTAADLLPDRPEAGRVQRRQQSQWYRPVLPDGDNTITLTLTGDPTVRTELALADAGGETIDLRRIEHASSPNSAVYEATLEPDDTPLLEIREPPRNVMFLWDTSPSMGAYIPLVHNALAAYAEDLVPGVDMANLLPFGASGPLLRDWYGEPWIMQLVLNDQPRTGGSSAAEFSQYQATRALASRNGTKAIVMMTDAHTSAHRPMWDALKEVQPRVFTIHVGTEDTSQDLMQDWASVNGGHYAYVTSEGEMEIAFERAAAMLRRPADYTVTMTTEYREAPGPGWLRVTAGGAGAGTATAGSAVELILDASGSMLQRMAGRRRIEIAREVLTSAVEEHIPAGTPTALRVFGHRTPNACETDLEISLAPLDPAAAAGKLAQIQAKNLARTPIAGSLAAVRRDLQGATNAVVVLVTDGEETCDGDPAAEIERLRSSGIDVSVNIVGFAIDDEGLADQFRSWADSGGGRYFAANDAEGLADAVVLALATPFTVYDQGGAIVAKGLLDGEDIALEQGVYRVVVKGSPAREFGDVTITGDEVTTLNP